jgi:hypothetical protein
LFECCALFVARVVVQFCELHVRVTAAINSVRSALRQLRASLFGGSEYDARDGPFDLTELSEYNAVTHVAGLNIAVV